MPYIGAHVSIAHGIKKAALRAKKQGCEVMQIFVQSPQTFKTPQTPPEEIGAFKKSCIKYSIKEVYVHAPYLINLCSPNNRVRYGSIGLIRKNLVRASALSCKYLMTHLGSANGCKSRKEALKRVSESIKKILADYHGTCKLLLEMSAGSGAIIGSRFEEIAYLINEHKNIGACLDTAHIFASGYDLTNKKAIDATFDEFDRIIGLSCLKLVHLNDSLVQMGSKKDRHADIGDGLMGLENINYIMNHPKLRHCNFILETPGSDKRRLKDILLLKKAKKT